MTNDPKNNLEPVAAAAASATAAATLVATRPEAALTTAIFTALVAAVGPTVAFLWQTASHWHVRQTDKWWQEVARRLGGEEIREEIEQRILRERSQAEREPRTAKVVAASVRTLLEGIDDAAMPALAALAAEYLRDEKDADLFFRQMARTLADLDEAALKDLQTVSRLATAFAPPGVDLRPADDVPGAWVLRQAHEEYEDPPIEGVGGHPRETKPLDLKRGYVLVGLLKRHGLGFETVTSLDRGNAFRCFLGV